MVEGIVESTDEVLVMLREIAYLILSSVMLGWATDNMDGTFCSNQALRAAEM